MVRAEDDGDVGSEVLDKGPHVGKGVIDLGKDSSPGIDIPE